MTYVDPMADCISNLNWRHSSNCHLFSDTEEELHSFGKKLGLKRSWFQQSAFHPHYDLTENKRNQAILLGAKPVDRKEAAAIWKQFRELRLSQCLPA